MYIYFVMFYRVHIDFDSENYTSCQLIPQYFTVLFI